MTKMTGRLRFRYSDGSYLEWSTKEPTTPERVHEVIEKFAALDAAVRELRMRELHHFEAEKAMVEALAHLRVAEGADRDILNGRPVMDAAEERAAAIRMAIGVLEAATTKPSDPS